MARIPIEAAKAGMKLTKEVADATGQVLARGGVEITDKHLRVFRSWGVMHIDIEGEETQTPEEQLLAQAPPQVRAKAEETAQDLFCAANLDHPVMRQLFDIAVVRSLKGFLGIK